MCKKYVNASARCYKSITSVDNNVMSYDIPFTNIRHDDEGDKIVINKFAIVTTIDFLGTNNENHKAENSLESKKTLDFVIRMTKCSEIETEQIGYDIDRFSINLAEMYEKDQVSMACFGFLNYTRTTNIDKLELPGGTGKYVIKILIKYSEDATYTIQSMFQLFVS
ncbi:MAG: hypothetical protein HDR21_13250 [Lachnospiraceae bacterium]|nr:hypothetical protein [Lachnospiraceae bacterium]